MPNLKKKLHLVLLIDDDDTTNYINKRVIDKAEIAGHTEVTRNGKEALHFLKGLAANGKYSRPPELIFVDIRMSVMDGYDFLAEYQQLPQDQKARVLIMLSSSASFYDLEKLKEYPDVKKHISKPLDEFDLREILAEFLPEYMDA